MTETNNTEVVLFVSNILSNMNQELKQRVSQILVETLIEIYKKEDERGILEYNKQLIDPSLKGDEYYAIKNEVFYKDLTDMCGEILKLNDIINNPITLVVSIVRFWLKYRENRKRINAYEVIVLHALREAPGEGWTAKDIIYHSSFKSVPTEKDINVILYELHDKDLVELKGDLWTGVGV